MARRIRALDDDTIKAILEPEDASDEELGSEENDDKERVVNESDHSADSEIDGDQLQNSDMFTDFESSDEDDENYYLCKDKVTKWCKIFVSVNLQKLLHKNCETFSWPNKQC